MSQRIIDLWRGDIAPLDRCGIGDREANLLLQNMDRLQTKLEEGLTEAQKGHFEDYVQKTDQSYLRMLELAFKEGFSLGSRLTAEAMT